ncbi:hypothetical protein KY290_035863 [Solanum tuberosum]|uniref:Uncharacterized protein n=1 Tax=Solanum tuberosum TaxID=4113 RepID=A0ABQ7TRY6_SOLTU|nr:hypothetical protein KY284_035230 [Solanum tuberosum]KAH0737158.1 hypothetical protein KY290_035863 [Solanum tuberosum]
MKPVVQETNNGKVTIKAECRANEEGRKHVEKLELDTKNVDTVKYVEKKLTEKGVQRLERHPSDGLPLKHDPKKGHGGKYTWEGPDKEVDNELDPVPPALDEKDPNYVNEETEEDEEGGIIVGEIEVAKLAEEGVARIEVDPNLKID